MAMQPDLLRSRGLAALALTAALLATACGGQPAGSGAAPPAAAPAAAAPAAAAPAAAAPTPAAHSLVPVSLALPSESLYQLLFAQGASEGFYRQHGIQLQQRLMAPSAAIAALLSGELDFISIDGATEVATLHGAPLRVLLYINPEPTYDLVVARNITSVGQLDGKTVAIVSDVQKFQGGVPIVRGLGGNPARVTFFVEHTGVNVFNTLMAGKVPGAILTAPQTQIAEQKGFHVLGSASTYAPYATTGLGASLAFVRKHPNLVQRMVDATVQSLHFYLDRSHETTTVGFLAHRLSISPQIARQAYEQTLRLFSPNGSKSTAGIAREIAAYRKQLKIQRQFTPTDIADMSFQQKAVQGG